MSTDKDWEKWGTNNPFYGVLSDPRFLGKNISSKKLTEEFFASGVAGIDQVMESASMLGLATKYTHAVDFGCGVGRLTVPLAKYSKNVTGLDISESVIKQARKSSPKGLAKKVSYSLLDEELTNLPLKYDLVHSNIVFQHIQPSRGEEIMRSLLSGLSAGGTVAFQITYDYEAPLIKKLVIAARNNFLPLHYLLNVLKGRDLRTPRMRMYQYDMRSINKVLRNAGVTETIQLSTNHGGYIGAMIIGQKRALTD